MGRGPRPRGRARHRLRRADIRHPPPPHRAAQGPARRLRILELGPGYTLAAGILLHAHGAARYVGADLYPIAGSDSALYRRLRTHLERFYVHPVVETGEALRRFDAAVQLDGPTVVLDESKVSCRSPVDAASLPFEDGSFDVVISLASFEHFTDPAKAARECSRVLAPGGVGLHQIDLRDHRDFSRPLEFLRYGDEEWRTIPPTAFRFTNRLRKSDFERVFVESGVSLAHVEVNLRTEVGPELRAQLHPDFRDRSAEDLEAISVFLAVRKPG